MKVTLEFNTSDQDEKLAAERAFLADKMFSVVWQFLFDDSIDCPKGPLWNLLEQDGIDIERLWK